MQKADVVITRLFLSTLILTMALLVGASADNHEASYGSALKAEMHSLSTDQSGPSSSSPENEVLSALLALKRAVSTNGFTDNPLAMWNTSLLPNYCSWPGVRCANGTRNVLALLLDSNQLKGTLPPQLRHLAHLSYLNVSNNSFHGQIPSEWGELSSLTYLDLSVNQLEGSIPAALANCTRLQFLDVAVNDFSGKFPSFLTGLSHLIYIDLSENHFPGEELPPDIGSLSHLQFLQLYGTGLSGRIPPSLANCTALVWLHLSDNKFTGALPLEWSKLSSIQQIFLRDNSFSGSIPATLGNCTALVQIGLDNNSLAGELPVSLGNLGKLQVFSILYNRISGAIPSALMNCSELLSLQLAHNQLSGQIPSSIGQLTHLVALSFSGNTKLAGQLPGTLGHCTKLERLTVRFTEVGGPLPMSIYNLSNLQGLLLSSSRFSGSLPAALGNLTSLTNLLLDRNSFVGIIPTEVCALTELQGLDLHQNNFQGPIPEQLWRFKRMSRIDLSFNLLSGGIPAALGKLQLLNDLYLQNNQLSGRIPDVFKSLKDLLNLDLSHNRLTGRIPQSLPVSVSLDLSFNNLVGLIPASLGNMLMLTTIKLAGNQLTGGIPDTLRECQSLQALDLSVNRLAGELNPSTFQPLLVLQYLDLSHNNLSGSLPESLGGLRNLVTLNVSHNALQGMIPSTGVYSRSPVEAFLGNSELCGYPLDSNCTSNPHSRSRSRSIKNLVMILICSSISGATLILVFVCVCLMQGPRLLWSSLRNRSNLLVDDESEERESLEFLANLELRKWSRRELRAATNGFDVANLLGSGGTSTCFKGMVKVPGGPALKKPVAIKKLNSEVLENRSEDRRSFIQELKILGQVRHRNLVSILGYCMDEGLMALVLEFMERGNLQELLHSACASLSWAERLSIALDVAESLVYLHHEYHHPIVHCDLKPANILLGSDMLAKVADFGTSKLVDGGGLSRDVFSSTSNHFKGTFGYAAPECASGWRISTKADVYSYGIVLIELMTGMKPNSPYLQAQGITLHTWATQAGITYRTGRPRRLASRIADLQLERILEQDSVVLQQFHELLELAVKCTRQMPQQRPNMKYVRRALVKVIKPPLCALHTQENIEALSHQSP